MKKSQEIVKEKVSKMVGLKDNEKKSEKKVRKKSQEIVKEKVSKMVGLKDNEKKPRNSQNMEKRITLAKKTK